MARSGVKTERGRVTTKTTGPAKGAAGTATKSGEFKPTGRRGVVGPRGSARPGSGRRG